MDDPRRARTPSIYLVQPKFPPSYWGMEHFIDLTPYDAVFPPLGLLTLAGLTPRDHPVTLCDENTGEAVDFDTDARIVCITGYNIQMKRVFEIGDEFERRPGRIVARKLSRRLVFDGRVGACTDAQVRKNSAKLFRRDQSRS